MFSSGLLIKGKTSLSNLVGMGSSIQVDDLDEDNVVVGSILSNSTLTTSDEITMTSSGLFSLSRITEDISQIFSQAE